MYTVRDATLHMFERYQSFNIQDKQIAGLLNEGIKQISILPIDKLSRWLGFIQGYVIFNNLTTVNIEREYSRPLFHKAYKQENTPIPISIGILK